MLIDVASLGEDRAYHLMMQTVIPRPVAWVLSDNGPECAEGNRWNVAPFSLFQVVATNPPYLLVAIGSRGAEDRESKDTLVNLKPGAYASIHVGDFEELRAVVASSAPFPPGTSEVSQLGLPLVAEGKWPVPRLVGPAVAFCCQVEFELSLGLTPQHLLFCRVHEAWIDDVAASVIEEKDDRLVVDPEAVDPIARLGGSLYARIADVTTMRRPMSQQSKDGL